MKCNERITQKVSLICFSAPVAILLAFVTVTQDTSMQADKTALGIDVTDLADVVAVSQVAHDVNKDGASGVVPIPDVVKQSLNERVDDNPFDRSTVMMRLFALGEDADMIVKLHFPNNEIVRWAGKPDDSEINSAYSLEWSPYWSWSSDSDKENTCQSYGVFGVIRGEVVRNGNLAVFEIPVIVTSAPMDDHGSTRGAQSYEAHVAWGNTQWRDDLLPREFIRGREK